MNVKIKRSYEKRTLPEKEPKDCVRLTDTGATEGKRGSLSLRAIPWPSHSCDKGISGKA